MKKTNSPQGSDPRFASHSRPNKQRASHDLSAWEEWVSEPDDEKRRRNWPIILTLLAGIVVLGGIITSLLLWLI